MINKCKIELCKQNKLKMDQLGSILFVLSCMYNEDYELLDVFDDTNSNKNALIIYKEMEKVGLLKREKLDNKTIHFSLAYGGKVFYEQLEKCEDDRVLPVYINERVADWIPEWIGLWKDESGIFLRDKAGKRSLGCSEKDAFERMNVFIANYGYIFKERSHKEVIIGATKNYLAEGKKRSYAYCKNAYNFIQKQEDKAGIKSVLAEWCENYIAGENQVAEKEFTFGRPVL